MNTSFFWTVCQEGWGTAIHSMDEADTLLYQVPLHGSALLKYNNIAYNKSMEAVHWAMAKLSVFPIRG